MPTAVTTTTFRYELIGDEDIAYASAIAVRCAWDGARQHLYSRPRTLTMDVLPAVFAQSSLTVLCSTQHQFEELVRRITMIHFPSEKDTATPVARKPSHPGRSQ